MRFGLLGPTEVADDGSREPLALGGAVPRRVLTALLVQRGLVVPVDSLVLAAWGDEAPATAERTLQSHVARLRDVLGRDAVGSRLTFSSGGYRLDVDADSLDTEAFTSAVAAARSQAEADPRGAVVTLEQALALWRGQPYLDLADTEYPYAEAARLEELRLEGSVDRAEYLLAAGQAAAAVGELEALLAQHRFLERAWELLAIGLYRQGRQADALAAYQRARTALDEELGVEPGPRLRQVEAQILAQDPALLGRVPRSPISNIPCPYKGLTRYDVTDARLFVGRERLVEELVASLVDRPLVVVVGPSGAGKSSLVRAGLLARLAQGAIPGSELWQVRVVIPHEDPLAQLRAALDEGPDLLVVDQAERAWSDEVADREAVADLVSNPGAGVRVVLVLRADFYGRLSEHPGLARRVGPSTVLVGPPSVEDLRRIVTDPARMVGLSVDAEVADEIVAQISGHAGVLPVVSTALVRLWEHRDGDRLTLASYRSSGGVQAALERAGEDAWSRLGGEDQQAAARRILVRLARAEDERWVSRRQPRDELAPETDSAARAALEVLSDSRLVVAHADSVEVAHEALFTGWPRLSRWLEEAASIRQELDRLAVASHDWVADGRDDAQLLRGARLAAATEVAASNPADLSAFEHEFVGASVEAADRERAAERERTHAALLSRRRIRIIAAALAVALVASVSAGAVAVRQARNAKAAAVAADAGRIGAIAKDPSVPIDVALLLAAQAESLQPGPQADSDLLSALSRAPDLSATGRSPSRVLSLSVSPDGHQVATAGVQGQIITWDTATLHQTGMVTGDPASYVGLGANGDMVVGRQSIHLAVQVYDAQGREITSIDLPQDIDDLVTSTPDWFAFVIGDGSVVELRRFSAPKATAATVPVKANTQRIFACGPAAFCAVTRPQGRPPQLRLIDAATGSIGPSIDVTSGLAPEIAGGYDLGLSVGSPDGRLVAFANPPAGLIELRALPSGKLVRTLAVTPFGGLLPLAFSPDDSLVAARGDEVGQVRVWSVTSGELVRSFAGHTGAVTTGMWSPDGRQLFTAGLDRELLEWDLGVGGSLVRSVPLVDRSYVTTAWAGQDATSVALYDYDKGDSHLDFANLATGTVLKPTDSAGQREVNTARSGGVGHLLAVTNLNGRVSVWDTRTGKVLGDVGLPANQLDDAETWVAPDGNTAATVRDTHGALYLIDLRTRKVHSVTMNVPPKLVPLTVLRWMPDGRHVLVAAGQETTGTSDILVVDTRTGAVTKRIVAPGAPSEVAPDPTGRWIAAGGQDGLLRFFSVSTGRLLAPPQEAVGGQVYNVSVSPDGRYVATTGAPGEVRLWDTTTFRQVGPDLPSPISGGDARVRFAPDGSLVGVFSPDPPPSDQNMAEPVTAGSGHDLRHGAAIWIYPVGRAAWVKQACGTVGRQLTRDEWNTYLPELAYDPACG